MAPLGMSFTPPRVFREKPKLDNPTQTGWPLVRLQLLCNPHESTRRNFIREVWMMHLSSSDERSRDPSTRQPTPVTFTTPRGLTGSARLIKTSAHWSLTNGKLENWTSQCSRHRSGQLLNDLIKITGPVSVQDTARASYSTRISAPYRARRTQTGSPEVRGIHTALVRT